MSFKINLLTKYQCFVFHYYFPLVVRLETGPREIHRVKIRSDVENLIFSCFSFISALFSDHLPEIS